MSKREASCTWDAERGWLTHEEHPCPKTHCGMRGRCAGHVDLAVGITCPSCIRRTRQDLAAIVAYVAIADIAVEDREGTSDLLGEASNGIDSEAFNLVGPAALVEHVDYRRGWCEYPRTDEQHPYQVLGRWDLVLRETYGPPTDLNVSVSRAAQYLDELLRGSIGNPPVFPHSHEFEDFAKQIAACRAHLETAAHDSRTPERGRPCPRCADDIKASIERMLQDEHAPRLRKRYADHNPLAVWQSKCDNPKCPTCDGSNDSWHCPDVPEHWWTEHDYRNRVATDYVAHADALPTRELAERTGVNVSTIRRWAAKQRIPNPTGPATFGPPLLKAAGRGEDGRLLYRVKDVVRLAESRGLLDAATNL